jgi:peptidoglycan/xylan/chitin deacetylase (PgdA/CDA1 family)
MARKWNSTPFLIKKGILRFLKIKLEKQSNLLKSHGSYGCISIDFDVTREDRFEPNRRGTDILLELSERYGIPMTWAVCGRDAVKDNKSYRKIVGCSVKQEIGVHTFSHIDAFKTEREEFVRDVKMCISSLGLHEPRTFVYPWNRVRYLDSIAELGFIAYRGKERIIGPPSRNENLWNIHPVFYVDSKVVSSYPIVKNIVEICIMNGAIFHLWMHPWNVGYDDSNRIVSNFLEPTFRLLDKKREEGMRIATCGDIAEEMCKIN